MKFNIKTATKYSSELKEITLNLQTQLRVNSSLVPSRYSMSDDVANSIPATNNGFYTATVTHKKSTLNDVLDKELSDEIIEVSATSDFAKIDPNVRLQMLQDVIEERARIDYEIEKIKNTCTLTDSFSGKELTYDLGCQINAMYREYAKSVLENIVEMNSTLTTTLNGKIADVSKSGDKGNMALTYPIEIEAKSNVDTKAILNRLDDIRNKINENSVKLSELEITNHFDFEPKFSLNLSIRSLIEKYSSKE